MRTPLRPAGFGLLTALLTVTVPLAPAALAVADQPTAAASAPVSHLAVPSHIASAQAALHRATKVMAGDSRTTDPTLALRDVALRLPEYSGHDRVLANRLLARPDGGNTGTENSLGATWPKNSEDPNSPDCNSDHSVCVHWSDAKPDRPPTTDANSNGIPDWVETTLSTMQHVWNTEVGRFGYRPPEKDNRASIDAGHGFDVYLSEIGSKGYYGYCTIDDSRTSANYHFYDRSAYCVLDNDFANPAFGAHTPLENLQVTAAHEFFHAIQFSYDAYEDQWLMEGTAAWMEDEVYTNINDNLQYLRGGQMEHPGQSLDLNELFPAYSTWGFFRYLSEHYSRDVIRQVWQRADGSKVGPDDYSLLAIRRALAKHGAHLPDVFADYAKALRDPAAFFSEGSTYPVRPIAATTLSTQHNHTAWYANKLDHLTMAYHVVRPAPALNANRRVRVLVNGPDAPTDPRARVLVRYRNGDVASHTVKLDRHGHGSVAVDFGGGVVTSVTAVLVNASDRITRCYTQQTHYSCSGGVPTDQNEPFKVSFALA